MGRIVQSGDAHVPILQRRGEHHREPGADFPRSRTRQQLTYRCRARRPANYGNSKLHPVFAPDDRAKIRRLTILVGNDSADKGGIPGEPADLLAAGGPVRGPVEVSPSRSKW